MTDALWAAGAMAMLGIGFWARFRWPGLPDWVGNVSTWVYFGILAVYFGTLALIVLVAITAVVWSFFA